MYNPNQPRLPAGDRYGGRWTATGLGGGPANANERAPHPSGPQIANAGTLAQSLRGLGPFGPAMIPYLLGVLARMAEGGLDRIGFLGGLVVAVLSELDAAHGTLPDHPDIRYRYKAGILTLWQEVPGENKPLIYHGPAGADGLYRLPDGTVIGRDLGTGVFLNQAAAAAKLTLYEEARAASPAANDNIRLCPDPGPDHPSMKAIPDDHRAKLYQQQITGLPPGQAVMLNGVRFDGCRTADGVMLEAKGEGFEWALQEDGEFFSNYMGERKIIEQMKDQSVAAGGRLVEWHFAEKRVADHFEIVTKRLGLDNIIVKHTPPLAAIAGAAP